jgi:S1-C subfamily serine protease
MTYTLRTITLHKRSDYDSFGIYLGEDVPSGVYIITVDPNSPASVANVQPGDRIIAVNGQAVSSMSRGPQEMITHLAKSSQSLTLALKSSNIVNDLHTLPNNTSSVQSSNNLNGFTPSKHHYYDDSKYSSNSNNGVDHQLEQ